MKVKTGLDNLIEMDFSPIQNANIGVLCNASSVDSNLRHIVDVLVDSNNIPKVIFAPEHGLYGYAQDQVGVSSIIHKKYELPIISLYGETFDSLMPKPEDFSALDIVIVDIQDVGSRYYTYVWTASMILEIARATDTKVLVLDRPNPIGGKILEGSVQENDYLSFVGLYPLPIRHGMTVAEILNYVNRYYQIGADIETIPMSGWNRDMWFDETGLLWVMPSPNMPTLNTAEVYPGMCLLEGTNISEGRGTTRPFEIFGAPFVNPYELVEKLELCNLNGVKFRPLFFTPTFNKYAGQICGGAQIHILDRDEFRPVITGFAMIKSIYELYPDKFSFSPPPYEYERNKLPFDILTGSSRWREMILKKAKLSEIEDEFSEQIEKFDRIRRNFLIYE
ncbi:DUF1343 domain-containing protein [bacterium]|nr:MAG: DUF1343 domain-containing protein [bacterium]